MRWWMQVEAPSTGDCRPGDRAPAVQVGEEILAGRVCELSPAAGRRGIVRPPIEGAPRADDTSSGVNVCEVTGMPCTPAGPSPARTSAVSSPADFAACQ